MPVGIPCRKSSGPPTFDTHPVSPLLESALAAPVVADRRPRKVPCATDLTDDPVAPQTPPDSVHRLRHCPDSPVPSPRPSPGSSACIPCQLVNGPSLHPSG